jgi:hypothetical protein
MARLDRNIAVGVSRSVGKDFGRHSSVGSTIVHIYYQTFVLLSSSLECLLGREVIFDRFDIEFKQRDRQIIFNIEMIR